MQQGHLFDKIESQDDLSAKNSYTLYKILDELYEVTHTCKVCPLGELRTNYVFGEGNPNAKVVVVGEAPGAEEDAQGRPFVGRSGKLLDKILSAIKFTRDDVFICNIVKCRPPGNREPQKDEIEACSPILMRQIQIIKPRIILLLGRVAANVLLDNKQSMSAMRGKIIRWNNIDVFVTYHPAALLRNPNWKRLCWEDVQHLRKHYDQHYAAD